MKKRNIIIISISTISLIFGGLVFLGVSTFPELLEEEKEQIEQSPNEDVLFELPSSNDNKANESLEVVTSAQGTGSQTISHQSHGDAFIKGHSFKDIKTFVDIFEIEAPSSYHPSVEAVSLNESAVSIPKKESTNYYKGASYTSYSHKDEANEEPLLKKEVKQEALNVTQTNNSAIMNTTIMAIGVVEVLSYLLVKRKRHHRFR